jgi:hypothetical protein
LTINDTGFLTVTLTIKTGGLYGRNETEGKDFDRTKKRDPGSSSMDRE